MNNLINIEEDACDHLSKYMIWDTIADRTGVNISKACILPTRPPCDMENLVVIKKLPISISARNEAINNIHIINLIQQGLLDPNYVLAAREVFVCEGYIYIVSDFIDGCSIVEYIEHFPNKDLTDLFTKIAMTVKQLEQTGMSHRDLHGENIIINKCGKRGGAPQFKIIDFGASYAEGVSPYVSDYNINFIQNVGYIPGLDMFTLITKITEMLAANVKSADENFVANILPDLPLEEQLDMIEEAYPKFTELARKIVVTNSRIFELIEAHALSEAPGEAEMLSNYSANVVLNKLKTYSQS